MTMLFQQRISAAFWAGAAFFCAARPAAAAPVEWKASDGGNGHFYEFILPPGSGTTWDAARTRAEATVFSGVHGHLGTITSAGEQAFVASLPIERRASFPYLGGIQAAGSTEVDQGWSWITGEPWDFTFWATVPQEPNDFTNNGAEFVENGSEQHLCLYPAANNTGWNDIDGRQSLSNSYLVEFDVPEPSSALLLPAAIAVLGRRRSPKPT